MTPREALANYLDLEGWEHTNPNGPSVTYYYPKLGVNQNFIHLNAEDIIIANVNGGSTTLTTIPYSDPNLLDILNAAINQNKTIATRKLVSALPFQTTN